MYICTSTIFFSLLPDFCQPLPLIKPAEPVELFFDNSLLSPPQLNPLSGNSLKSLLEEYFFYI